MFIFRFQWWSEGTISICLLFFGYFGLICVVLFWKSSNFHLVAIKFTFKIHFFLNSKILLLSLTKMPQWKTIWEMKNSSFSTIARILWHFIVCSFLSFSFSLSLPFLFSQEVYGIKWMRGKCSLLLLFSLSTAKFSYKKRGQVILPKWRRIEQQNFWK